MGDVEEKRRREREGDGGEWSRGGGKSRCHRSGLNGDDLFASLGYGMFKVLLLPVASANLWGRGMKKKMGKRQKASKERNLEIRVNRKTYRTYVCSLG